MATVNDLINLYTSGWNPTEQQKQFWEKTIAEKGFDQAAMQFQKPTDLNADRVSYLKTPGLEGVVASNPLPTYNGYYDNSSMWNKNTQDWNRQFGTNYTTEQYLTDVMKRTPENNALYNNPTYNFDSSGNATGLNMDVVNTLPSGFTSQPTSPSVQTPSVNQPTPTQQQPSWMGQWETMQDQFNQMMQGWQTQQQAQQQTQQPSYGYNGSNTRYNYQPVYSNPLMRPVTANSNIAPQQAPSNMGYQNRTSLWGDV